MTNHLKPLTVDLNDSYIDAQIDFRQLDPIDNDGNMRLPIEFHDARVKGLRIRLGKHRHTWTFYREWSDHLIPPL